MTQTPKKKKLLPKNIADKSDSEVAEKLFGKQAKRELDRIVEKNSKSMKQS